MEWGGPLEVGRGGLMEWAWPGGGRGCCGEVGGASRRGGATGRGWTPGRGLLKGGLILP